MFVPAASRERVQLGCPYIILDDECGRTLPAYYPKCSRRNHAKNYVRITRLEKTEFTSIKRAIKR